MPPQVSVPPGALDCWVFLSCLEVLQRIEGCCDRAQIDSNIAHTVGLWSYATEKVTGPVGTGLSVWPHRGRSGCVRACLVAAGTEWLLPLSPYSMEKARFSASTWGRGVQSWVMWDTWCRMPSASA